MTTYIHFKLKGAYRVFAIGEKLTHEDVMGLLKIDGIKPDGAVMLTYGK